MWDPWYFWSGLTYAAFFALMGSIVVKDYEWQGNTLALSCACNLLAIVVPIGSIEMGYPVATSSVVAINLGMIMFQVRRHFTMKRPTLVPS